MNFLQHLKNIAKFLAAYFLITSYDNIIIYFYREDKTLMKFLSSGMINLSLL